jgi:hypothetical protein
MAVADTPNAHIATHLGIDEDTARKWRRRFCDKGLEGLRAHLPGVHLRALTDVIAVPSLGCRCRSAERETRGGLLVPNNVAA